MKYLYEPKHKSYCNFWVAFTYSFAVHRCRIKRHSQRHFKQCYIVNIYMKTAALKKQQQQKSMIMIRSDKSTPKLVDFPETFHAQKNRWTLFISIAKYLFARCRTRMKRQVLKIYFYRVHRVASSLLYSWAHIKMCIKERTGEGGGGGRVRGNHLKFTFIS